MLRPTTWPCPDSGDEYALVSDQQRGLRLLILPALFDEANKMRRVTVEIMRLLAATGIDSFLPDLPGWNESHADLTSQSLTGWRCQAIAAAKHFGATACLTIRAGAMLAPPKLQTFRYSPLAADKALRAMLRARIVADREAGLTTDRDALLEHGAQFGLTLSGYSLGTQMLAEMQALSLPDGDHHNISQGDLGGAGLWLRAEPGYDASHANTLARLLAETML